MIRTGKCKLCNDIFRENGEFKFRETIRNHFQLKHTEEFTELIKKKEEANIELKNIQKKYPELYLTFGLFNIDYDEQLKEGIGGK